tara:strand:+ start:2418 stop:2690 length:273 start_codon:yes stop_codon:yes gene_type:complete
MGRIWLLEKQNLVLLSNDGLKKTGKTLGRVKPVADAKVKNGVLHIVAPAKGFLPKPQKLPVSLLHPKRDLGLPKRNDWDNPQVSLAVLRV